MTAAMHNPLMRLTLARQFMIASLIILVTAALGLGWWVGQQIERNVVHRTAATTALFVESFVSPNVQELATDGGLTAGHIATLDRLLEETPLGREIVAFKIWDQAGKLLYSAEPSAIGQVFPPGDELRQAWEGAVTSEISTLDEAENVLERTQNSVLLETYSPVRMGDSDRIIAVAEFYQAVGGLQDDIAAAQRRVWLVVGLAMGGIYLLLAGFVGRASDTIEQQRDALSAQVAQLTDLLAQNAALHDRVRRAAARTTALNERVLRRISADLHDGPVQDLGLALLRLDHALARATAEEKPSFSEGTRFLVDDLEVIQSSLQRALGEIRALSAGLGVPHLNSLTLRETMARVVRVHEGRTGTTVALDLDGTPERASLPVKITLYRLVQEALSNATRHAGGVGQAVALCYDAGRLHIEVSDAGPGFVDGGAAEWNEHLGLVGMRERVESLGGNFRVASAPGQGTKIIADLSIGEEVSDE
ncbi:MAG: sensor histidine kinase [Candidatus Promineofilum sp.]|nr:sensor histidine kinase [Promineifilum sp.]